VAYFAVMGELLGRQLGASELVGGVQCCAQRHEVMR